MTAGRDVVERRPPTLGIAEAAWYLGISRATAYRLAATGELPVPVLRIGNSYRIPSAPLFELLGLSGSGPDGDPSTHEDVRHESDELDAPVEYLESQSPGSGPPHGSEPRDRATRIPLHGCRRGW